MNHTSNSSTDVSFEFITQTLPKTTSWVVCLK